MLALILKHLYLTQRLICSFTTLTRVVSLIFSYYILTLILNHIQLAFRLIWHLATLTLVISLFLSKWIWMWICLTLIVQMLLLWQLLGQDQLFNIKALVNMLVFDIMMQMIRLFLWYAVFTSGLNLQINL